MPRRVRYIFPVLLVLMCISAHEALGQRLAVKTNLVTLAAGAPSAAVEVVTGEKSSVSMEAFGSPFFLYGSSNRLLALRPEWRYWFNGRPLTRAYACAGGLAASYDLAFPGGSFFRGEAVGLGIGGGYVLSLGKRWSFDLGAGTGILLFRQMQAIQAKNFGYKLFPVKLEASFIYIIR